MVKHPRRAAVIEPRKLMLAVMVELVVIGLGLYGYFETDNIAVLIVAAMLGSLPVLLVVLTAARPETRGDIVSDARRSR